MDLSFYKGKKVLITGHTGFKGSWMCEVLLGLGAEVSGYALNPPTNPALFDMLNLKNHMKSITGDIRDLNALKAAVSEAKPDVIVHMAAQPIVRDSYKDPVYTYETNVMGTVNILEALRACPSTHSFINVTTDKVYLNKEWAWGYRENEELNGFDPYSNSKSCSELVTSSYKNSFFSEGDAPAISTCRAGNVIGGGDFANDRIIPDCVRAVSDGLEIIVRNPHSTRPYQHVLEPVCAYLMIAAAQFKNPALASAYNVGPNDLDCYTTGKLVDLFCAKWNENNSNLNKAAWIDKSDGGPHEANFLKLDCSKLKTTFGWQPRWSVETAMEKITEWESARLNGEDIKTITRNQIKEFLSK